MLPKGIAKQSEESWPTPCALDRYTIKKRKAVKVDSNTEVPRAAHALSLQQAVLMWPQRLAPESRDALYPTPMARDYKDTAGASWMGKSPNGKDRPRLDTLPRVVYNLDDSEKVNGELNADFVEWLMGFPLGWTTLRPIKEKKGKRLKFGDEQWGVEPDVPRIISGDADREGRIEALGNAVVPQVVVLGPFARVMQLEQELHSSGRSSEEAATPKRKKKRTTHRSSPNQQRG